MSDKNVSISKPEPAPVNRGREVAPSLLAALRGDGFEATAGLVEERAAYGIEKYGQPLMTEDGRDAVEDCRQELGDALQYAWSAKIRGDDITGLSEHATVLLLLLLQPLPPQIEALFPWLSREPGWMLWQGE